MTGFQSLDTPSKNIDGKNSIPICASAVAGFGPLRQRQIVASRAAVDLLDKGGAVTALPPTESQRKAERGGVHLRPASGFVSVVP
jgi:hypothetical protein